MNPKKQKLLLMVKPEAAGTYVEKWVTEMLERLGSYKQPGISEFFGIGGHKAILIDLSDYAMRNILADPDAETALSLGKLSDPVHRISLKIHTRLSFDERRQFGEDITHRLAVGREGDLAGMLNDGEEITKVDPALLPAPAKIFNYSTRSLPSPHIAAVGLADLLVVLRNIEDINKQNNIIGSITRRLGNANKTAMRPTVDFFAATGSYPAEAVYSIHSTPEVLEWAREICQAGSTPSGYKTKFTEEAHPKNYPGFKRGVHFFAAPRLLEISLA